MGEKIRLVTVQRKRRNLAQYFYSLNNINGYKVTRKGYNLHKYHCYANHVLELKNPTQFI